MTMTVLSGSCGIIQIVDMPEPRGGRAGSAQPVNDNPPPDIIEIGSLGAASPPLIA